MKLQDSPAVKIAVPKYNDLKESSDDARVHRATGEVHSGGNVESFHSPVQAEPDEKLGNSSARTREIESEVTFGHHVSGQGAEAEHYGHGVKKGPAGDASHTHAPTPEAQSRKKYTDEQYAHRDFYAGTRKE